MAPTKRSKADQVTTEPAAFNSNLARFRGMEPSKFSRLHTKRDAKRRWPSEQEELDPLERALLEFAAGRGEIDALIDELRALRCPRKTLKLYTEYLRQADSSEPFAPIEDLE